MDRPLLKLITLNTWGGRALHPLMGFLEKQTEATDIFCLQEMFNANRHELRERHPKEYVCANLFEEATKILPGFRGFFAGFKDKPHLQSQAIFVRKGIALQDVGDHVVYKPEQEVETGSAVLSARKLQYVVIRAEGKQFTIANFHGLWNAGPKTDTPERIEQSVNVRAFLDSVKGPKILCGDFNLNPDTNSFRILERGMQNPVRSRLVTSTRTALYRKHDDSSESKYADYILTSIPLDVAIHQFSVMPHLVSDHAPLFLEFS